MFGAKKKSSIPLAGLERSELEELLEEIRKVHQDLVRAKKRGAELDARVAAETELADLKDEIETMKREKERLVEEHQRRERETEHKVGLLRKEVNAEKDQVEKDLELAKRDAELTVREQNLDEATKRLEDKLTVIEKTLGQHKDDFHGIVRQLIDNLPNMNVAIGAGAATTGDGDDA